MAPSRSIVASLCSHNWKAVLDLTADNVQKKKKVIEQTSMETLEYKLVKSIWQGIYIE